MSQLLQDIRYALRGFRASPGFTAAAVLSLAIGIGANTAIFSVTNALLLRPLPYKDASRLVILWNRSPGLNILQDWFSPGQYFDIKESKSFEDAAIAIGRLANITGEGGAPERATVVQVSSNLMPLMGIAPARGRLFTREEDSAKSIESAILSDGMWARRYGRDQAMVGKSILINGRSAQVVGILPRGFVLPHEVLPTLYGGDQVDIYIPMPFSLAAHNTRTNEDYNVIAKLKPGVTVQQAQAEMDTITVRLRRDHPDIYPPNGGLTFGVVPLLEQVVGDVRLPLIVLLGSVAFVLMIACANVANLLLSRAVARQREIAIRSALGAGRRRIILQLLTESLTLAAAGAALGLLFAIGGLAWVRVLGPASVPRIGEIGMSGSALLFTGTISILSGVLFGLAPAWRLSRVDLQTCLKDAGRGTSTSRGSHVLRRLLVVSELALSVVLLIGAGLLIRSFARLQNVSPGFNPHGVLTFDINLPVVRYADRAALATAQRELSRRLENVPGVVAAGGVSALPFSTVWSWGPINVEGRTPPAGEKFINADQRIVSGHYFDAMQIPLLRGRLFNDHDVPENGRVVIIDEYMAQEFWPNEDPIGKRIRPGGSDAGADSKTPWETVVGVVGRVKQYTLDADSRIAMYYPQTQSGVRIFTVVLRSTNDPQSQSAAAAKTLHDLDPDLAVYAMQTMDKRIEGSLARRRFTMTLLAVFAVLAFALAAIGTYGVMSYQVTQGERELGIRIALGATQGRILKLVVGQGAVLAAAGVALGLGGAFALTRLMNSLLFGVKSTDPLTFLGVSALLGAVALAASFVPARRASRVDPMVSLRCD